MTGIIPSKAFNDQLVDVVKDNRRTRGVKTVDDEFSGGTERITASRFRDKAVILDEPLPPATHALTGASSGLATVCRWSVTDGKYSETETQLVVWNHSESSDHAANTFGAIRFIDGHWWFFGDCEAMAER